MAALLLAMPRAFAADSLESVPAGEDAAASRIVALISGTVAKDAKELGRAHRDAHAKAHGCVRAQFRVEDKLPAELQRGVFQEGRVYKAWIRYSNGAGRAGKDSEGDGRGMAIKLLGVPGPKLSDDEKGTQDFLMINSPVFFVRNAAEYVPLSEANASGRPFSFFISWNPFHWRFHDLHAALGLIRKKTTNPLDVRYWSLTPYALGDGSAMKFSARPCAPPPAEKPDREDPDFLRKAMAARLKDGSACFEFLVQPRTDEASEPIEDPTIDWNEKKSPFLKIATIDIPAQAFDSSAQQDFCENLSMNPWHSVPELRPLGGINRVRRVVYEAISKLRHGLNDVPRAEPTGDETF